LCVPYWVHWVWGEEAAVQKAKAGFKYSEISAKIELISVESLSAHYLKHFGNKENVTPFLDSLIPNSIFFENFYASGTRTVRGLEAISLAIPPTPGQSIVRRPGNAEMFTMGNVLKTKGYDVNFIYAEMLFLIIWANILELMGILYWIKEIFLIVILIILQHGELMMKVFLIIPCSNVIKALARVNYFLTI
jgi:glucan phosphoethanolaminetransferase (alkaline phosphatase superfamily)